VQAALGGLCAQDAVIFIQFEDLFFNLYKISLTIERYITASLAST
jgi:hypothetical protein